MQELVIEKLNGVRARINKNDVANSDLAMSIKAIASGNLSKHNNLEVSLNEDASSESDIQD
jgi:hypothetical protein